MLQTALLALSTLIVPYSEYRAIAERLCGENGTISRGPEGPVCGSPPCGELIGYVTLRGREYLVIVDCAHDEIRWVLRPRKSK